MIRLRRYEAQRSMYNKLLRKLPWTKYSKKLYLRRLGYRCQAEIRKPKVTEAYLYLNQRRMVLRNQKDLLKNSLSFNVSASNFLLSKSLIDLKSQWYANKKIRPAAKNSWD